MLPAMELPGEDPMTPDHQWAPGRAADAARPPAIGSDDPSATEVELWTPRYVGLTAALIGYPGGVVLAALNWRRMNQSRKAIVHLVAAVIGTCLIVVGPSGIGIFVWIIVAYYLYRVQKGDQASFSLVGGVTERSGPGGTLIALAATLLTVVLIAASGVMAVLVTGGDELAHRGEVLFGSNAGTDVCTVMGQASEFGPTDSVFLAAVMREKVETGARVVYEVETQDGTSGPYPVTARPPFDCLGSTDALDPLEPGTYVVRYRYDAQPDAPDLASGTLTIRPAP